MKTVLFRGKQSSWILGGYNYAFGQHYIFDKNNNAFSVHPDSIGQYIGAKDSSGAKVFTGDILEDSDGRPWLISFGKNTQDNSIASFTMKPLHSKSIYPIDKSIGRFTIIGNLFDNPSYRKI